MWNVTRLAVKPSVVIEYAPIKCLMPTTSTGAVDTANETGVVLVSHNLDEDKLLQINSELFRKLEIPINLPDYPFSDLKNLSPVFEGQSIIIFYYL